MCVVQYSRMPHVKKFICFGGIYSNLLLFLKSFLAGHARFTRSPLKSCFVYFHNNDSKRAENRKRVIKETRKSEKGQETWAKPLAPLDNSLFQLQGNKHLCFQFFSLLPKGINLQTLGSLTFSSSNESKEKLQRKRTTDNNSVRSDK